MVKKHILYIWGQNSWKRALYYRRDLRGNSTFWMIGPNLRYGIGQPSFGNWSPHPHPHHRKCKLIGQIAPTIDTVKKISQFDEKFNVLRFVPSPRPRFHTPEIVKLSVKKNILIWCTIQRFEVCPQPPAPGFTPQKLWNCRSNCVYNSHVFLGLKNIYSKFEGKRDEKEPSILGAIGGKIQHFGWLGQIYTLHYRASVPLPSFGN